MSEEQTNTDENVSVETSTPLSDGVGMVKALNLRGGMMVSLRRAAQFLGEEKPRAERALNALVKEGYLVRVGAGRHFAANDSIESLFPKAEEKQPKEENKSKKPRASTISDFMAEIAALPKLKPLSDDEITVLKQKAFVACSEKVEATNEAITRLAESTPLIDPETDLADVKLAEDGSGIYAWFMRGHGKVERCLFEYKWPDARGFTDKWIEWLSADAESHCMWLLRGMLNFVKKNS